MNQIKSIFIAFVLQLDLITTDYPELMCKKCERNMQLAAKIRRDLLVVDGFWKKFLQKHGSKADDTAQQYITEVVESQSSCTTPVESIFRQAKVVLERMPSAAATPLPIEEVKIESFELNNYDNNDYNHFDDYDDDDDCSALEEDRLELKSDEDETTCSTKPKKSTTHAGVKPIKGEHKHFKCSQVECEDGK